MLEPLDDGNAAWLGLVDGSWRERDMGGTRGAQSVLLGMAAGMAALLLLAGCGTARPSPTRMNLTNADTGRTVSMAVGGGIDLTLGTVGPGQYSATPTISSGAMRLVGVTAVGPPTPAGPRQLFRFDAIAPGRTTITIPHTVQSTVFEVTADIR